jgi:uncharacterized protein
MVHRETFVNKIKNQVLSIDKNATVVLFGSRARKDFREDSDWDFLILASSTPDEKLKRELRDKLFDTELETEQIINVSCVCHYFGLHRRSDLHFKVQEAGQTFGTDRFMQLTLISTIIHSYEDWQNLSVTTLFQLIEKEGLKI